MRRRVFIAGDLERRAGEPDAPPLLIPAATVQDMLDTPRLSDIIARQKALLREGAIAGDILATLYLMFRFDLRPSINRAIFVVGEAARTAKYRDGSAVHRANQRRVSAGLSLDQSRRCGPQFG